jgi:predicted amidohydrolase YtcJ
MELVERHLPARTPAEVLSGAREGLRLAASLGITSLFEASADEEILAAYLALDRRGELTARVRAAFRIDPAELDASLARAVDARGRFAGARLRVEAIKIFADGVIEARTAAMLEPYTDRPGDRGPDVPSAEAIARAVVAADREGFQIHVHAIGDRAVRAALDAMERARRDNGARDARPLIAHAQVVHPDDRARFAALGVIADFQPLWAYRDAYIIELTEPALGPERSRFIYPIGSIARTGAALAFGSDWSVTSMNPLEGIEVAVTRRDPELAEGAPWLPDERVDLATALRAYTLGGAHAAFTEEETGAIVTGRAADLVVLDRNLFETPEGEIAGARVVLTLVEGVAVYRAPPDAR